MKRHTALTIIIAFLVLGGCAKPTESPESIPSPGEDLLPSPMETIRTLSPPLTITPAPSRDPNATTNDDPPNFDRHVTILARIDNATPYQDLITHETDIVAFIQRFDPEPLNKFNGRFPRIEEVDDAIGIECLRNPREGTLYSVHEITQGGLMYLFYRTLRDGEIQAFNYYYVKARLSSEDFAAILAWERLSIEEVAEIDPSVYVFIDHLHSVQYILPVLYRTYHYLSDGTLSICFEYLDSDGVYGSCLRNYRDDFNISLYVEAHPSEYDGRILPMDMF